MNILLRIYIKDGYNEKIKYLFYVVKKGRINIIKYAIGQMVSVPRYDVKLGEITGIHVYSKEKGDSVNSIDYDINFYSDGCWFRESYSEEHLEE